MIRIQAYITNQDGGRYTVEALAEGVEAPFIFTIDAKSDKDAAMEAIRRVEAFDGLINKNVRAN